MFFDRSACNLRDFTFFPILSLSIYLCVNQTLEFGIDILSMERYGSERSCICGVCTISKSLYL